MAIEPLHPAGHAEAALRLRQRLGSADSGLGGAVSSVAAAADPYAQMRANPLQSVESVKPGDPGASVRPDVSPNTQAAKRSSSTPVVNADSHVRQSTVGDRAHNPGTATVEEFENGVDRKQRLEGALDIRQASGGRRSALSIAEQRPDLAPVAIATTTYRDVGVPAAVRAVQAVSASHGNRAYGQEAAASTYRRVAKGVDNSSILGGSPNLESPEEFDTLAGVAIPRVGVLK